MLVWLPFCCCCVRATLLTRTLPEKRLFFVHSCAIISFAPAPFPTTSCPPPSRRSSIPLLSRPAFRGAARSQISSKESCWQLPGRAGSTAASNPSQPVLSEPLGSFITASASKCRAIGRARAGRHRYLAREVPCHGALTVGISASCYSPPASILPPLQTNAARRLALARHFSS